MPAPYSRDLVAKVVLIHCDSKVGLEERHTQLALARRLRVSAGWINTIIKAWEAGLTVDEIRRKARKNMVYSSRALGTTELSALANLVLTCNSRRVC